MLAEIIAERNTVVYVVGLAAIAVVASREIVLRWLGAPAASSGAAMRAEGRLAWLSVRWFSLLFIAALAVRAVTHDFGPYWYDEAFSVWLAQLPLDQLIAAVAGDVHPPLFYALTWLVAQVAGTEPIAMRALPLVFSVLSLPVAKRLAEHLQLPGPAQFVGLALMAFSPFQIFYANDVRAYSLMLFLVLLAVLLVVERRFGWLSLAWTALLWTHHYGLIFCAVTGLLALALEFRQPERNLKGVLLAGVTALLFYAPWAATLAAQLNLVRHGHWIWPVTAADLMLLGHTLLFGSTPQSAWVSLGTLMVAVGLEAVLLYKSLRTPLTTGRGVLLWLLLAPVVTAALVSVLMQPIFVARYLFPVSPFWFFAIGWVITDRVGWRTQALAALVIAPLLAITLSVDTRAPMFARGAPREVAATITEGWRQGDAVVHTDIWTRVEAEQFLGGRPQYLFPPRTDDLNIGGLSAYTRDAMGIETARFADLGRYRRLWVVDSRNPIVDQLQRAIALTDLLPLGGHRQVDQWARQREQYVVTVYLVTR